jgi:hypothetical protein
MPWAAGSYTKGNSGTGGWVGDASLGIGIEAGRHDTQDNDFATGINQCLNKDGSNAATGNLNLGGFLPTNIGAGTAAAVAIAAGNDVNTGIFAPAADTWAVATNGTERVRVLSDGKVGIGTTSPAQKLEIAETTNVTNIQLLSNTSNGAAATSAIYFRNDAANPVSYIVQNSSGNTTLAGANSLNIGTNGAYPVSFLTSATERMRIDSAGNVGIGTTTAGDVRLFSKGSSTSTHYSILGQNSSSVTCFGVRNDGYIFTGTAANSPFNNTSGAAANCVIAGDGILYRSTSSLKYKEQIEDMLYGLDKVMELRPVTYKGKAQADGEKRFGGLVAEEVHDAGLLEFVQYANDGTPDALAYGNMVALAFKAIQELNAKVEALQARVAELEGA